MPARLMSARIARAWFGSVSIALLGALTVAAVTNHAQAAEIHWRTNHFSYVAHDKPLKEFIRDFAASQGVSVVVAPEVSGTVNGKFDNTPQDILDMLSTSFGVTWYYDGSVLYISPGGDMASEVVQLGGVSATQLQAALSRLGVLDPRYPISYDRVHDTARVAGPKRYVELVSQTVEALNQGGGPSAASNSAANMRTEIRLFQLHYAWAADFVYTTEGQDHTLPGVVTVLRNLYPASRPAFAAPIATSARQNKLDRLRGMGYFRDDQVPESGSPERLTPLAPRQEAGDYPDSTNTPAVYGSADLPQFQADGRMNAVIVRDVPERMAFYEAIIKSLDVKPALVEIEARVIEVSDDSIDTLGVDWRARSGSASISLSPGYTPNTSSTGTTTTTAAGGLPSIATQGLTQPLIIPGAQLPTGGIATTVLGDSGRFLMARVSALSDHGKAHVVSSPRVLTLDNVEAVLEDMSTFYIPVQGNLDVGLYNVSAGTSLRVTPLLVNEGGKAQIKLAIRIEDGGITQQTVGAYPVVQKTSITTQAFINEGESLLIGGLKSDVHNDTKVGIPGLSAIPGLGALFRHQQKESSHVEHLFMLTPRVVEH